MDDLTYSLLIELGDLPNTLTLSIFCNENDCGIDGIDNVPPAGLKRNLSDLCRRNQMLPSDLSEVWGGECDESINIIAKVSEQVRNGLYDKEND